MKSNKLTNIIKEKSLNIPLYIYKIRDKFDVDLEKFIFLIYLYNKGEKIVFDINIFSSDLGMDIKKVMECVALLQDKKLITLDVLKNDKNISEEYISLELFYSKITKLLIEDINTVDEDVSKTIFDVIEQEFGRTLTPMEYEIIKAWFESNYSEELIKEAVREASFNGVSNLRYIDKILYEWNKKGVKNKEDVEKSRVAHKEKEKPAKVEVFDYDWMDE